MTSIRYELWGEFDRNDFDLINIISSTLLEADSRMPDGTRTIELQRIMAEEDGNKLVLLSSFEEEVTGSIDDHNQIVRDRAQTIVDQITLRRFYEVREGEYRQLWPHHKIPDGAQTWYPVHPDDIRTIPEILDVLKFNGIVMEPIPKNIVRTGWNMLVYTPWENYGHTDQNI